MSLVTHPVAIPPAKTEHWRRAVEPAIAFLATALFYIALYGELPYHDVARFVGQVEGGTYVFDIAHVLLQPATLLWHTYLGAGEPAELSQKHINTFATAAGIAIFIAMLARLSVPAWQRVFASILVATSCSLIILAPSGHMKLVAFPFVNASLYVAMMWERRAAAGSGAPTHLWQLILAGVLLAIAAAFLVSCLAVAPFAAVAIVARSRCAGSDWRRALVDGACFALACGVPFAAIVCLAFTGFSDAPLTVHALLGSVAQKEGLRPGARSAVEAAGRLMFGVANNMIAAPLLGSVLRGWIAGYVPSLRPYAPALVVQGLPWLATLGLIAVIYVRAAAAALRRHTLLVPLSYLLGALAWAGYYSLNDPEHWFQQTVPMVVLFLLIFQQASIRIVLPVWTVITAAVNLATIALPQATYPLARYEAELRRDYSDHDLLIDFAAYPGGHYLGFFSLPGIPTFSLDTAFLTSGDRATFASLVRRRIDDTLGHGGQVVVFGVLDPDSWDAPWPTLIARGLSKTDLRSILADGHAVEPVGEIAEIKAWRVRPLNGPQAAPR